MGSLILTSLRFSLFKVVARVLSFSFATLLFLLKLLRCKCKEDMSTMLSSLRFRDVTTHPHSKESRPEIWKSSGIARDTQVGDDPLFPMLPPFQNDLTIEL